MVKVFAAAGLIFFGTLVVLLGLFTIWYLMRAFSKSELNLEIDDSDLQGIEQLSGMNIPTDNNKEN